MPRRPWTEEDYADHGIVKKTLRLNTATVERLEELSAEWGTRGIGEVVVMLLAMHDEPKKGKRR